MSLYGSSLSALVLITLLLNVISWVTRPHSALITTPHHGPWMWVLFVILLSISVQAIVNLLGLEMDYMDTALFLLVIFVSIYSLWKRYRPSGE